MKHIDRIAPTRRPKGPVAGYQRWSDLVFLHWPVPLEALRPLVPESLSIDTYDGVAWVGIVPFAMRDVRPSRFWPKGMGFNFLETNVRTYVHVEGEDPGVYFFSLDAASWPAVKVARSMWSLPYHEAKMDYHLEGVRYRYDTTRKRANASLSLELTLGGKMEAAAPDSLEFFLFERYLLHVERRGSLMTGQVHHSPYPTRKAKVERCEQSLLRAAGFDVDGLPHLAHYSAGVDVDIFALRRRAHYG